MARSEGPGDSRTVEAPSPSLVYGATVELQTPGRAPPAHEELALPPTERAPRRGRRLAIFAIGAAVAATAIGIAAAMLVVQSDASRAHETEAAEGEDVAKDGDVATRAPARGRPCPTAPAVARVEVAGQTGPTLVDRLYKAGFSCTEAVDFGDGARLSMRAPDRSSLVVTMTATDLELGLVQDFANLPTRSGAHGRMTVRWPDHHEQAQALLDRVTAPE